MAQGSLRTLPGIKPLQANALITTVLWVSTCTIGVLVLVQEAQHNKPPYSDRKAQSSTEYWIQIAEVVLSGLAMSVSVLNDRETRQKRY